MPSASGCEKGASGCQKESTDIADNSAERDEEDSPAPAPAGPPAPFGSPACCPVGATLILSLTLPRMSADRDRGQLAATTRGKAGQGRSSKRALRFFWAPPRLASRPPSGIGKARQVEMEAHPECAAREAACSPVQLPSLAASGHSAATAPDASTMPRPPLLLAQLS